jgi:glycerol uptake facilitator-like aquaporin
MTARWLHRPQAESVGTAVLVLAGAGSAAHVDPPVTTSLAAPRRFPWSDVVPHVLARLLGRMGAFVLLCAVTAVAVDSRAPRGRAGRVVGESSSPESGGEG